MAKAEARYGHCHRDASAAVKRGRKTEVKTFEELYQEITASEEQKKAFVQAQKEGKVPEFLKAHGYSVTEKDLAAFTEKQSGVELSDDELDDVAGGCGNTSKCLLCGRPVDRSEMINGMHPNCFSKFVGQQDVPMVGPASDTQNL